MANSNNNEELKRAVSESNLERVKALLSAGADANLRLNDKDRTTFLHYTNNLEIMKQLLLHNACVNAKNDYKETPLHYAITKQKEVEFVKELLKHGAYVNATDCRGYNTVNKAVTTRGTYLEVIQELLEYGADINIRNRVRWGSPYYKAHATALDNAVESLDVAKLLIKVTLLKNFDKGYKKIIDLSPYTKYSTYSELSSYLDECVREIVQMKTCQINANLSLYEFIAKNSANINITLQEGTQIADQLISNNYPIYYDMIFKNFWLQRPILLDNLSKAQIYVCDPDVKGKSVILNYDCAYKLAKYLSNDDLLNLVKAFYKRTVQDQFSDSSDNVVESQQVDSELDEAAASSSAKRAKLESPCND